MHRAIIILRAESDREIPCPWKPSRVWAAKSSYVDLEALQHHHNALLQDEGHDWRWSHKILRYSGPRLIDGSVVLILEFDR